MHSYFRLGLACILPYVEMYEGLEARNFLATKVLELATKSGKLGDS